MQRAAGGRTSSKGVKSVAGKRADCWRLWVIVPWGGESEQAAFEREKRGEPLSVPRCNKLGTWGAEQTVEVVRNHKDGTRF
jgi:hypothetical protein